MTTLAELKQLGAFIEGRTVVRKVIEFTLVNPETSEATDYKDVVIHVKKLSIGDKDRLNAKGRESSKRSRAALLISDLVTLGDGSDAFPFQEAFKLDEPIALAMMVAIREVNGTPADEDGDEPKN